jgi:hypothetical protein
MDKMDTILLTNLLLIGSYILRVGKSQKKKQMHVRRLFVQYPDHIT